MFLFLFVLCFGVEFMLLEPYVRIPSFSEVRGRLMSNSCSLGLR